MDQRRSRSGVSARLRLSWLVFGLTFVDHWWGVAAAVWSFFPLSAGIFDVCWVSAALGGPLRGKAIRARLAGRLVSA